MTEAEAIALLNYHCAGPDELETAERTPGFLCMLRPFTGELYESNFKEMMEIIKTLKPVLQKDTIKRDIITDLWSICHCTRLWGIDEGGMLRRNKLITSEQVGLLTKWADEMAFEVMMILMGQ